MDSVSLICWQRGLFGHSFGLVVRFVMVFFAFLVVERGNAGRWLSALTGVGHFYFFGTLRLALLFAVGWDRFVLRG